MAGWRSSPLTAPLVEKAPSVTGYCYSRLHYMRLPLFVLPISHLYRAAATLITRSAASQNFSAYNCSALKAQKADINSPRWLRNTRVYICEYPRRVHNTRGDSSRPCASARGLIYLPRTHDSSMQIITLVYWQLGLISY